MELIELQRALARLSTDASLREQFLADPEAAGLALGLPPGSGRALAELPARPLDVFARSLLHKRMGEVGKMLPHTRRVLGERFAALFLKYARGVSNPAHSKSASGPEVTEAENSEQGHSAFQGSGGLHAGPRKHQADAVAFAAYLQQVARAAGPEPPWVGDLARYEAMWLQAQDPHRRWTAALFRYPVLELIRRLAHGEEAPGRQPVRVTLAVWVRLGPKDLVKHAAVALPHPGLRGK